MPLGMEVGLGPGDIVLDGDPAPPRKGQPPTFRPGLGPGHVVLDGDPAPPPKGHTPSTNFQPVSIVAKRSPISATAEHLC